MYVGCVEGKNHSQTQKNQYLNFNVDGPLASINVHLKDNVDGNLVWGDYDFKLPLANDCLDTFKNTKIQGVLGIAINPFFPTLNYQQGVFIDGDSNGQIVFGSEDTYRSEKPYFQPFSQY